MITSLDETKLGQYNLKLGIEAWLKYMNDIFLAEQLMLEKHKKEREWQKTK